MSDETTSLAEQANIGAAAERLMQDPCYELAMQAAEDSLTEQWKDAELPDRREMLWGQVQALRELHRQFEILVQNGVMARAQLEKRNR